MSTAKKKNEEKGRFVPPVTIEGATLRYKNFTGAAKKYNAKGLRNFHVVLNTELAKILEKDGWNVRWHDPKEDGDEAWASIKVAVRFDNYPPRIVMITGKNRTVLDEDTVEILDWAEIKNVDVMLSPSSWEVNGKKGIKAYLKKLFVTLSEEDLEAKYSSVSSSRHSDDDDSD